MVLAGIAAAFLAPLASPAGSQSPTGEPVVARQFHSYVPADAGVGAAGSSGNALWLDDMNLARTSWRRGEFNTARTHLRRALKKGNLAAAWYLGHMYQYGRGVKVDPGKAFHLYRKVALTYDEDEPRRGQFRIVIDSLVRVGDAYRVGLPKHGIRRDPRRAFNIYTAAAGHQHPAAYYGLGLIYLKGIGMKRRPAHGTHWLKKAAQMRFVAATTLLGDLNWGKGKSSSGRIHGLKWYLLTQQSANPETHGKVYQRLDKMLTKVSEKERARAEQLAAEFDASHPLTVAAEYTR